MALICNKCGAELEEGALFCASCGAKTESPSAEPEKTASARWTDDTANETAAENRPEPPITAQTADSPHRTVNPPLQTANEEDGKHVSVVNWLCRDLITLIPCVGTIIYIIMLFVWAFDRKYDETSRNWAKARLIFTAVCIVIMIIATVAFIGMFFDKTYDEPANPNSAPSPFIFFGDSYGY